MNFVNSLWSGGLSKTAAEAEDTSKTEETRADDIGDGQPSFNDLTQNAFDMSKKFGGLLYNLASSASEQVLNTADNAGKILDNTPLLSEFSQEREKFAQETSEKAPPKGDCLPWSGFQDEEGIKAQILGLSLDERNFLRDPPSGVDFMFDMNQNYSQAVSLLEIDRNLQQRRYELVPRKLKEDAFWRNYFYRVTLIKQSAHINSLAKESASECTSEVQSSRVKQDSVTDDAAGSGANVNDDFVSDSFDSDPSKLEQMRQEIHGLESSPEDPSPDDDDIERELDELNEFELVTEDQENNSNEWEKEIEAMLHEEKNAAPAE